MTIHTASNPHWSVEPSVLRPGTFIRLIADPTAGTCAVPCDRYGNILDAGTRMTDDHR